MNLSKPLAYLDPTWQFHHSRGRVSVALSWMDWRLERYPMAGRAASAFAVLALMPADETRPRENHAAC